MAPPRTVRRRGARSTQRTPARPATHHVVTDGDADHGDGRGEHQDDVQVAGCAVAEQDRQGALAATVSVGMSRRLLATRIAQASAPTPMAAYSAAQLPRLGLDVRRADHRDQPEEHEDHHLAEPEVAVGLRAAGVEPRGQHAQPAPTATSHHAVVAASTRPASRGHAEGQERGRLHRARRCAAPDPTSRSGPTRSASVPRMPSE